MMISKKVPQNNYSKATKEKVVIPQQMRQQRNNFKRKKKKKYYKYKQSACSDAGAKDKSVKNDHWPIGTTVIGGGSILNSIVEEKLCGQGYLVKFKRFLGSTVYDLSHHIIPIIESY